jgi:hypothetical protein
MPVRPSRSVDVVRLIADLRSTNDLQRESAVARLAVIGPRAASALIALARDEGATIDARAAALRALETMDEARIAALAVDLSDGDSEVLASHALALLGPIARGTSRAATRAFDRLAAVALDVRASTARRLAAIAALDGQPARLMRPVFEALSRDPAARLLTRAARTSEPMLPTLDQAVERGRREDAALAAAILRERAGGTVSALHRALKAVRERAAQAPDGARAEWTALRGQIHQELAARGSRVALYDLRDALGHEASPLPVGFLAAATAIGDVACLEPLARHWVAADPAERWVREHLADAFAAIVRRERVRRRHPALAQILKRWPATGPLIARAPKK